MSCLGGGILSYSRLGLGPSRTAQSTLGTWNWVLKSNHTEELEISLSYRVMVSPLPVWIWSLPETWADLIAGSE